MVKSIWVLIVVNVLFLFHVKAQEGSALKLWYNKPSGNTWENALPIGNGFLGAMVYGNVGKETIQLNESTIWSGSPYENNYPEALNSLGKIRQLIFDGSQNEAESLANKVMFHAKSSGQMFQPAGSLNLQFEGQENYTDYYRELDIEKATTKTTYKVGNVLYTREALASFPDRVIVMRLSASKKGAISFTASYTTPHTNAVVKTSATGDISIEGLTSDHEGVKSMVRYKNISRFRIDDGSITITDSTLNIVGASGVTIYISIATNFINYKDLSGDENKKAYEYLDKTSSKSFTVIKNAHIPAYQKFFNRVKFDLGTTDAVNLPTDERLSNFRNIYDPQFIVLYYQFGRYLLICSSQPGGQPATLQGLWNGNLKPAWDSKYTININTEMNYWPAERTNLAEMHEPLFQMIKEMSENGAITAKTMYGARGWMAHHNTDIWRATGPVDGAKWGIWNAGGAWLSQHLWEHYLYNGDQAFLRKVYPILKGTATFYKDFLVEHPKYKWLVVNPGTSPENSPTAHGGSSLDAGTTMDNQIVFDVLTTTIRTAKILNVDEKFVDTLLQIRKCLPPMHIGQYGQLQEWLDDIDNPNDKHRHISHLYGLFPSNQISAYRTPELFSAAKVTLGHRGDVSTGWSMGWKVNWWARMQNGNHAYMLIKNQLTPLGVNKEGGGTYNNLFDAHPPFQIDGNFGCTSGITEMLMQTADGAINILPALPDEWKSGSIGGIRAWGGFEIVSMEWSDSRLKNLVIKSSLGGNLRLRVPVQLQQASGSALKTAINKNKNPFFYVEDTPSPIISTKANVQIPAIKVTYLYDVPTTRGGVYTFVVKD